MTHRCHAEGCPIGVPPAKLMCKQHWRMVPVHLRFEVYAHYRPGQEISKDPSPEYIRAAKAAIEAVHLKENPSASTDPPSP